MCLDPPGCRLSTNVHFHMESVNFERMRRGYNEDFGSRHGTQEGRHPRKPLAKVNIAAPDLWCSTGCHASSSNLKGP